MDARISGRCRLMNDSISEFCEWIIEYPPADEPSGKDASQLVLIGRIMDDPSTASPVMIIGGTGLWENAIGNGTFTPNYRSPVQTSGLLVGDWDLQYTYA